VSIFEVKAKVAEGGTKAVVRVGNAEPELVHADTEAQLRQAIVRRAAVAAQANGSSVRVVSSQSNGVFSLIVSPAGELSADEGGALTAVPSDSGYPVQNAPAHRGLVDTADAPRVSPLRETEATAPFAEGSAEFAPPDLVESPVPRRSFLLSEEQATPPTRGWRGMVSRATGIKIAPSIADQDRHENVLKVSQHWPGGCSIGVVNGKGGVGKTTTTAMLAAVFARHGGSGVVAWDNNDTRGTLGWRTEASGHNSTIPDLLAATDRLLHRSASLSDLAGFVHHQGSDKYDVLRSNPTLLATEQRLTAAQFDALNEIIEKYSRMIVFDSGNDESSERWLRMIDRTDQLVLPTDASAESAESAALLLEELSQRDEHSADLARRGVVVISVSERSTPGSDVARIVDGFTGVARATVVVPHDPALKSGLLRFDSLRTATQDAWIAAGAAVADGLLGHRR
jgi:MinD-like ATPase involved in chromosome partitioning or flagellar assembly